MLNLGTVGTSWITQSFIEGAKTAGGISLKHFDFSTA